MKICRNGSEIMINFEENSKIIAILNNKLKSLGDSL